MMNDVECPYCGEGLEICHDDGHGMEEDELHEDECSKCGKAFVFTTSISISHEAQKAACLNGAPHDYERTRTYPPEFARLRCTMCGDEKPLDYDGNVPKEESDGR